MTWVSNHLGWIAELTWIHLVYSIAALALSMAIALPLGWLANRWRLGREAMLALVGAIYAIPSLPMFIVIPLLTGTPIRSSVTMVVVLSAYGVALLIRTVADAYDAVSGDVRRQATALGYSPLRRVLTVDLPLAGPMILAGFRVVIVSTVSLVTVGAVVGIQSLGSLFTDGFQRGIVAEVLAGLVMTLVLALMLDGLAVLAGRVLFPWTRVDRVSGRRRDSAESADDTRETKGDHLQGAEVAGAR